MNGNKYLSKNKKWYDSPFVELYHCDRRHCSKNRLGLKYALYLDKILRNKKAHAQNAHTYTNTNTRKHHIPHSEISFMEIVIHENE